MMSMWLSSTIFSDESTGFPGARVAEASRFSGLASSSGYSELRLRCVPARASPVPRVDCVEPVNFINCIDPIDSIAHRQPHRPAVILSCLDVSVLFSSTDSPPYQLSSPSPVPRRFTVLVTEDNQLIDLVVVGDRPGRAPDVVRQRLAAGCTTL